MAAVGRRGLDVFDVFRKTGDDARGVRRGLGGIRGVIVWRVRKLGQSLIKDWCVEVNVGVRLLSLQLRGEMSGLKRWTWGYGVVTLQD